MKKASGVFIGLFFLFSGLDLLSCLNIFDLRWFSKPFLLPLLMGLYLIESPKKNPLFLAALFCAFMGDVILLLENQHSFLIGLLCFLTMQILYSVVFYKQTALFLMRDKMALFLISIFVIACLSVMVPHAGAMKMPLIIYALIFGGMAIIAHWRHKKLKGWLMVFIGVLFFVCSDALLGINKFVAVFSKANFWIMFTYIIGQFMIVKGYLKSE